MTSELVRLFADAKLALPYAVGLLLALLLGFGIKALFDRHRVAEARRALEFADEQLRYVDCIAEPTGEFDMVAMLDDRPRMVVALARAVGETGEWAKATFSGANPPDWTPQELTTVKAMTDRSSWPTSPVKRRGQIPNLRPWWHTRETPKSLGERIARIRAQQKASV